LSHRESSRRTAKCAVTRGGIETLRPQPGGNKGCLPNGLGSEYASGVEVAASNAVPMLARRPATLRVVATGLLAALLVLAPGASARTAASLSLVVTFSTNGTITVTLPNGTPVGSTSGTPTVIPAGSYTIMLVGPGGCTYLPVFELRGPGENILDDMRGGEWETYQYDAYFLPNSTYTWRNDANPAVVYTFRTSADVLGTPSANGASGAPSGKSSTVGSQDIVGSGIVPFRGTLNGSVSAAGRLTIAFKGKSVSSLKAGRYTVVVSDKSSTNGFLFQKLKHHAMSVTSGSFVGKRSVSLTLTSGKWLVLPQFGKATYSILVN
jgi:hypothetical protein